MELANNAIIDLDYYTSMNGTYLDADEDKIIATINYVSMVFEKFCNRVLKARTFDYAETITVDDVVSANPYYDAKYSIFDGIEGVEFYLPTYPANSITTLMINDVVIAEATGYADLDGYHLYKSRGKIVYYGGFYNDYHNNVKIKWNGGYTATDAEMEELKFLCYDMVKTLRNSPLNSNLQSEKIGNYAYTNYSPRALQEMSGLNAVVFSGLKRYRKEVI
jgi:hypothetical protein